MPNNLARSSNCKITAAAPETPCGRIKRNIRRIAPIPKRVKHLVRSHVHQVGATQPPRFDEAKTLGQRLAICRIIQHLSQSDVAERTAVTSKHGCQPRPLGRTTYCMYEIDAVEPKSAVISALAATLNVSPSWLAFGTGNPWDHDPTRQVDFDTKSEPPDQIAGNWVPPDKLLALFKAKRIR